MIVAGMFLGDQEPEIGGACHELSAGRSLEPFKERRERLRLREALGADLADCAASRSSLGESVSGAGARDISERISDRSIPRAPA